MRLQTFFFSFFFSLLSFSSSSSLEWRDLTPSEYKEWYSDVERCMLENEDRFIVVQNLKQKCTFSFFLSFHSFFLSSFFPSYPIFLQVNLLELSTVMWVWAIMAFLALVLSLEELHSKKDSLTSQILLPNLSNVFFLL